MITSIFGPYWKRLQAYTVRFGFKIANIFSLLYDRGCKHIRSSLFPWLQAYFVSGTKIIATIFSPPLKIQFCVYMIWPISWRLYLMDHRHDASIFFSISNFEAVTWFSGPQSWVKNTFWSEDVDNRSHIFLELYLQQINYFEMIIFYWNLICISVRIGKSVLCFHRQLP